MESGPKRTYHLGKRREDVDDTRRKIVEAAVALHGSVGPVQTTFTAVAEKAGVQRTTVYRHFPDEAALFGACTSHWLAAHPWPRANDWRTTADASERLIRGLTDLYVFYEENEAMIANSIRDIETMPPFVGELMSAQLRAMHDALLEAWPDEQRKRQNIAAAINFALDFRSARALASAGFSAAEGARLIAGLVGSAATVSS